MNVSPDIHKTEIVLSTRWGCINLMLTTPLRHTNQFSGTSRFRLPSSNFKLRRAEIHDLHSNVGMKGIISGESGASLLMSIS